MLFNFNARTIDPAVAMQPLPPDEYPVTITDSSLEQAESGGKYIKFEMTVVPGHPFAGRKLFFNANIENKNPQAVEIAYRQISAICHCIGRYDITKTEEMHGVPFKAVVTVDKSGYNNTKGFKDINGNEPGKTGAIAAAPAQGGYSQSSQYPPAGAPAYPPAGAGYGAPTTGADPSAGWQRSPDGAFKLNPSTNAWEPNTPPNAPPPPPPPTAPAYPPAQAGYMPGGPAAGASAPPPPPPMGAGWTQQPGSQPGWVKP